MEEAHRVAEAVFDEHAVSIAGNQLGGSGSLIGQENGRFFMAEVDDADLPQRALVTGQRDAFVEVAKGPSRDRVLQD